MKKNTKGRSVEKLKFHDNSMNFTSPSQIWDQVPSSDFKVTHPTLLVTALAKIDIPTFY